MTFGSGGGRKADTDIMAGQRLNLSHMYCGQLAILL